MVVTTASAYRSSKPVFLNSFAALRVSKVTVAGVSVDKALLYITPTNRPFPKNLIPPPRNGDGRRLSHSVVVTALSDDNHVIRYLIDQAMGAVDTAGPVS